MYSVFDYGRMIADPVRMRAYREALAQSVQKGAIVVDLGAGTGIFSLWACEFGAKRVHAIESNPAVNLLHEIARANGYGDRIIVHHGSSFAYEMAERADVLVSDLRGVVPLQHGHIPAIVDARRRLLAPGGVMIPESDKLVCAMVEAPGLYHRLVDVWRTTTFDLDVCRRVVANEVHADRVEPIAREQLLTDGTVWAEVSYAHIEEDGAQGEVDLAVSRAGIAHGMSVWFQATLARGISFSTEPGTQPVYARLFLPFEEPCRVAPGDRARVRLRALGAADTYVWSWHLELERPGQGVVREVSQSSFAAQIPSAGGRFPGLG